MKCKRIEKVRGCAKNLASAKLSLKLALALAKAVLKVAPGGLGSWLAFFSSGDGLERQLPISQVVTGLAIGEIEGGNRLRDRREIRGCVRLLGLI